MQSGEQLTDRRIRAAHLAAHAVCAHLVGRAVMDMSLDAPNLQRPWEDTTPVAIRAGYRGEPGVQARVERGWLVGEGAIRAAGMAAEFLLTGDFQWESARKDLDALDRFAAHIHTGAATWSVEVFGIAVRRLRANRRALDALTDALLDRGELDAATARALLEEHCSERPG